MIIIKHVAQCSNSIPFLLLECLCVQRDPIHVSQIYQSKHDHVRFSAFIYIHLKIVRKSTKIIDYWRDDKKDICLQMVQPFSKRRKSWRLPYYLLKKQTRMSVWYYFKSHMKSDRNDYTIPSNSEKVKRLLWMYSNFELLQGDDGNVPSLGAQQHLPLLSSHQEK